MNDGQALNKMKECQALNQMKECQVACQLRQCDSQALNQMKEGQVACQLRQCDDNEFHVTFELRTDGVFITNIPYNNITPRIVTPAKLLQINHENVECDMTRFREMMTTLKQNKVNDLVVDGEIKSCLKQKQHSGRRTSKRKRLESHHVNFDLSKNQTKIVDRYIMSEERAKHILRQVLKERMRAAIRIQRAVRRYLSTHVHANERKQAAKLIQRAVRRYLSTHVRPREDAVILIQRAVRRWLKNGELRVMLNSDRHSLQTFYNVGFTDAEMSRYVAYHSSGRPMQYRGRPVAIHAPSKFATRIQSVVRGFLGRCAQTRKVDKSLGIEAVLKVMKARPRDARVQREACEVLSHHSWGGENRRKIAQVGGIEVIITAMKVHPDAANIQEQALGALSTLAGNADNRVKIAQVGGIEAILSAMKAHPGEANVQEPGCNALFYLAMNNDNKVKIAKVGGIEVIINAMKEHSGEARVQEEACRALCNLVVNTANRPKISQAGGIETMIAAMEAHPDVVNVIYGCWFLCDLASKNAGNRVKIAKAGGIEAITKAMKAHPSDVYIQGRVCLLLYELASDNTDNQIKIVRAGGIEAIQSLMKAHPEAEDVQQYGWLILHTFHFATRIQTAVRRYLAKKKYLEYGEQMHTAFCAIKNTDNAIFSMQKTKEEAIHTVPVASIDACIRAYRKYIQSANVIMAKCQDSRNNLVRRFPRLLENMMSEEDIKSVFYDTRYGFMVKCVQVLRWLAQLFYQFKNEGHITGGKHWSGVGTSLDTLDYNVSIPLATMFTQFKDSKTKSYDEVDNYLHPKPPVRCKQLPVLEVNKQKFRTLLSIFKSITLSSPSVNCTVYFNLMHVQQEVTSLARRLDRSLYCFVNVLPLHRQNDSLYPVKKVHKYDAEPDGDVLRQKVGNPYAIVPLEDSDRNMFIDDQGKRKKRPINEYATKLAGFPIYGDVAVAANKKRKLNVKMERKTM